jgi:hypothetical protein
MVEYGATLAPPEQGALAAYLAKHLGKNQKEDSH